MFKKRRSTFIVSILLILVTSLSFLLSDAINLKQQLKVRTIDSSNLGTLSYEEKAEQILSGFDNYDYFEDQEAITFEASVNVATDCLSQLQYLSTEIETTTKKYVTRLDAENEKFYIITQYIQEEKVVYEEKTETVPYYDEYSDDYYVQMPDGTVVSMYETLKAGGVNECLVVVAGLAITAAEAAVLLAALVIVAAPVIYTTVVTIVTTIVTLVRSFFSWLRSLWKPKTVTKTAVVATTVIAYSITIADTKVDLKRFDENKKYEETKYYVAVADTVDGFLYVSDTPIDDLQALAILTRLSYVSGATKNKNGVTPQLVISVYTPNGYDAYLLASEAGTILMNPGATHHAATRPGYFNHYHPGGVYKETSHPHVFYGEAL